MHCQNSKILMVDFRTRGFRKYKFDFFKFESSEISKKDIAKKLLIWVYETSVSSDCSNLVFWVYKAETEVYFMVYSKT